LAKYPPIPARLRKIDELTRLDHYHLGGEDDCYYLWEWDVAPYSVSAINDFIGNFQREMRFKDSKDSPWPWHFKKQAMLHAARAIAQTMLPEWQTSTFIPVPPSKTRDDPRHDPRLIRTLLVSVSGVSDARELVIQTTNTQSREKHISPSSRAANWTLDQDLLTPVPPHIVVFDDLLTGGSHFAAMKLVLARNFPYVPVSGLFLARRLRQSLVDDPGV
jgi:hypothetical protein